MKLTGVKGLRWILYPDMRSLIQASLASILKLVMIVLRWVQRFISTSIVKALLTTISMRCIIAK